MNFLNHNVTIVFDLDGTLLDTAPDLIVAVNHVLKSVGGETLASQEMKSLISLGGREMIKFGLQKNGISHSDEQLNRLCKQFIDFYSKNLAVLTKPFPGLFKELDRLSSLGYTLTVCTNKLEAIAKRLLLELELLTYFELITGRDTYTVCKPNPNHLLNTISDVGGDPTKSIMIGDSETDVITAQMAGVYIVGVTFGYSSVPVSELGCNAIISHYDQLKSALNNII
ncbi:MAG: Phosphoglycolate phosphatase [Hyphomicrobiaceae bacterium hypho_1]